jgi:hypothetical protein
MAMVNVGPDTDDCIPPGKVYLLDGWINPSETVDEEDADGFKKQAV